jgi:hypothetical protein
MRKKIALLLLLQLKLAEPSMKTFQEEDMFLLLMVHAWLPHPTGQREYCV